MGPPWVFFKGSFNGNNRLNTGKFVLVFGSKHSPVGLWFRKRLQLCWYFMNKWVYLSSHGKRAYMVWTAIFSWYLTDWPMSLIGFDMQLNYSGRSVWTPIQVSFAIFWLVLSLCKELSPAIVTPDRFTGGTPPRPRDSLCSRAWVLTEPRGCRDWYINWT